MASLLLILTLQTQPAEQPKVAPEMVIVDETLPEPPGFVDQWGVRDWDHEA